MNQPATLTVITEMTPHPNADTLSLVKVESLDYQIIGKTSEWNIGDICVYVEPDSILPDRPQYEWLGKRAKHRRIRATKIRGLYSFGLLVRPTEEELRQISAEFPVDRHWGQDVSEIMGITHYQPDGGAPNKADRPGVQTPWPSFGKFGVANIQRDGNIIAEGDPVVVTEKLHGQNARFSAHPDGEGNHFFYAGTRNVWFDVSLGGHPVCDFAPKIGDMLLTFDDCIFYFERLNVQGSKWRYDCPEGKDDYRMIAVRNKDDGTFWRYNAVMTVAEAYGLKTPMIVREGNYNRQRMTEMASGESEFESQPYREGVVIQRMGHSGQPDFLKSISPEYLAGK